MHTANIKDGNPPADSAIGTMIIEIEAARFGKFYAIKIIHGYGSHNVGGTIKKECHLKLIHMKQTKKITDFIKGEELSTGHKLYNKLREHCPDVIIDHDFVSRNPGITIVIL